jgi:hypothetical protein
MNLTERILNAVLGNSPNATLKIQGASPHAVTISKRDFSALIDAAIDADRAEQMSAVPESLTPIEEIERLNSILIECGSERAKLAVRAIKEARDILEGKRISVQRRTTPVPPAEELSVDTDAFLENLMHPNYTAVRFYRAEDGPEGGDYRTRADLKTLIKYCFDRSTSKEYVPNVGQTIKDLISRVKCASSFPHREETVKALEKVLNAMNAGTVCPAEEIGECIRRLQNVSTKPPRRIVDAIACLEAASEALDGKFCETIVLPNPFKEHLSVAVKLGELDEATARYVAGIYDGARAL